MSHCHVVISTTLRVIVKETYPFPHAIISSQRQFTFIRFHYNTLIIPVYTSVMLATFKVLQPLLNHVTFLQSFVKQLLVKCF
jgi:hypothetical protein